MRTVLTVVLTAASALAGEPAIRSTSALAPRKVIVGTMVQNFWVPYPGLEKRLQELTALVDQMAERSQKLYGRGLDLAVLPEAAVTGEISGDLVAHSVPLEGAVKDAFARTARQHRCYIVVPLYLLEDREKGVVTNAAVLIGRKGEVAGIYRKAHPAVHTNSDSFEGGIKPGDGAPVFECDFGKLGIQICFDIEFDEGWRELARKDADLVAWPTQSPQTAHPVVRAIENRLYIVSSTWRENATVFEPTGKIVAQARPPERVLVQELDLSYAILPWSPKLRNGAALRERYGDKVGFRYYVEEDQGIFWSNDPRMTIREMVRSVGLAEAEEELQRIRKLFEARR